jgi:hypothetical protein
MTAEAVSEGDTLTRLLARAHAAADLTDLAEVITMIISRARSARVDQEPLAGLADAARELSDGDAWVAEAMKGNSRERYPTDAEMFEAIRDMNAALMASDTEIGEMLETARDAQRRARTALRLAELKLTTAMAMPVQAECDGCHAARDAAIDRAREAIGAGRRRQELAAEVAEVLKEGAAKVDVAMKSLARVPEDYETFYAEALLLVREDPQALPKDTDFLTGYGSRLVPRKVTARAADMIRSALQLGPGTHRTEEVTSRPTSQERQPS